MKSQMSAEWHLCDSTLQLTGRGLHHMGGWVTFKADNGQELSIHAANLPALAATFAEASRVLIDLDRQQQAKLAGLSNVSEALVTGGVEVAAVMAQRE